MENRSFNIRLVQFVICVGLLCVIWGGYFPVLNQINRKNAEEKIQSCVLTSDYRIATCVESVKLEDGELLLTGWGLRVNSKNSIIDVVLKSTDEGAEEVLLTESIIREDVNKYFDPKWEFGESGFKARISEKKLGKNKCYEILLVLAYNGNESKEERKKVETNRYIYNNELYCYNPTEFVEPQVKNFDVTKAIKNGKLCVYDLKKQIWVYEYDGELFWIIKSSNIQGLSARPEIPMFVYTTQREMILDDKGEADYFGYYFNEEDLNAVDESDFLIHKMRIPDDHPVISIQTGIYNNVGDNLGWQWVDYFSLNPFVESMY